ncbi:MAG: peptidoglycan DD-metalloendopeptidase family protein [Patescibacteria group bacterium]
MVYLYNKSLKLGAFFGLSLLWLGKYTFLPSILLVYRNILKIRIKSKNIKFDNINYIILVKKYLPSAIIVIIIISVTTNNIFAQNYSTDEYANRTLLSNIIPASEDETASWSELIEETGPAINQAPVVNYLDEQGALQQLVVATPFAEEEDLGAGVSPDSSSLVLLSPEDTLDSSETPNEISRTKLVEYTVQAGDVIGSIAEKFGVSANTILWENDLTWNSTIRAGQKLNILQDSGINHKVKSGDTILAIAKKYQTEAEKIVAANKLADSSDISIGDMLFIPDGVPPTKIVSSYTPPKSNSSSNSSSNVIPPDADDVNTGTKLLWPLLSHKITQYYHWGHSGLDVGDKTGNPIYAAEAGKVEKAGWNSGGYGNYVIINHGNGLKTLYGHASKVLVSAGDSVSRGQTIALVGSTGRSTGPHLHFEVRVNEAKKNPLNYIK